MNIERPDYGVKVQLKNAHVLIVHSAFFVELCLVLWPLAIHGIVLVILAYAGIQYLKYVELFPYALTSIFLRL